MATLGIDIGSRNSKISVFEPSTRKNVFSFVYVNDDVVEFGSSARLHQTAFSDFKRFMGVQGTLSANVGNEFTAVFCGDNHVFHPVHLTELLLVELQRQVASDVSTKNVVLSFPTWFTAGQRKGLEIAAKSSGLNVIGMISDLTAASLNFSEKCGSNEGDGKLLLIIDVGFASTQMQIVNVSRRLCRVITRSSEETCGIKYLKSAMRPYEKDGPDADKIGGLSEDVTKPFVQKFTALIDNMISKAGIDKKSVDYVQLVGGGSDLDIIQAAVKSLMLTENIEYFDSSFATADGCAAHCARLTLPTMMTEKIDVEDILNEVISVQFGESEPAILFPKMSAVPAENVRVFDHQAEIILKVLYSSNNTGYDLEERFSIKSSEPDVPENSKFQISFQLTSSMIVRISNCLLCQGDNLIEKVVVTSIPMGHDKLVTDIIELENKFTMSKQAKEYRLKLKKVLLEKEEHLRILQTVFETDQQVVANLEKIDEISTWVLLVGNKATKEDCEIKLAELNEMEMLSQQPEVLAEPNQVPPPPMPRMDFIPKIMVWLSLLRTKVSSLIPKDTGLPATNSPFHHMNPTLKPIFSCILPNAVVAIWLLLLTTFHLYVQPIRCLGSLLDNMIYIFGKGWGQGRRNLNEEVEIVLACLLESAIYITIIVLGYNMYKFTILGILGCLNLY